MNCAHPLCPRSMHDIFAATYSFAVSTDLVTTLIEATDLSLVPMHGGPVMIEVKYVVTIVSTYSAAG